MKPKARLTTNNRLWIVWDGVSFANGQAIAFSLEVAYKKYLEMQVTLNSVRDLDRAYRNLAFWHSQSGGTL